MQMHTYRISVLFWHTHAVHTGSVMKCWHFETVNYPPGWGGYLLLITAQCFIWRVNKESADIHIPSMCPQHTHFLCVCVCVCANLVIE